MGDWSMPMTLSTHSIPCTSSHWPGRLRARLPVTLPRPRTPEMLSSPELMALKAQLMQLLLREVAES